MASRWRPAATRLIRIPAFAVPLLAVALLLLLPEAAFAWGPATHVQIGMEALRSLNLFPPHIAGVIAQYPIDFLYGNLAADISLGKKYAQIGRHCHNWGVAREIHRAAGDDERLQAAMLGYLCHLSADVLAHNSYVPRMLLLTSSTRGLGHSYWTRTWGSSIPSSPAGSLLATTIQPPTRSSDACCRARCSASARTAGSSGG